MVMRIPHRMMVKRWNGLWTLLLQREETMRASRAQWLGDRKHSCQSHHHRHRNRQQGQHAHDYQHYAVIVVLLVLMMPNTMTPTASGCMLTGRLEQHLFQGSRCKTPSDSVEKQGMPTTSGGWAHEPQMLWPFHHCPHHDRPRHNCFGTHSHQHGEPWSLPESLCQQCVIGSVQVVLLGVRWKARAIDACEPGDSAAAAAVAAAVVVIAAAAAGAGADHHDVVGVVYILPLLGHRPTWRNVVGNRWGQYLLVQVPKCCFEPSVCRSGL